MAETEKTRALEWGPDEGDMAWDAAMRLAASRGDGWRLPTVQELVSQFDYDKGQCAAGFRPVCYWSSSPNGDGNAWYAHFGIGNMDYSGRDYELGVRLVREVKP